jgi:hypothetical protein
MIWREKKKKTDNYFSLSLTIISTREQQIYFHSLRKGKERKTPPPPPPPPPPSLN